MGLSRIILHVLLLVFLVGPQLIFSQTYLSNVRALSENDGLSHNQVNCILQDREGFIWIGTKYGLNRYDGHEFKWFTKEQHGLGSNYINEIYEDEKGWLWLVHSEEKFGEWGYINIDLFNPLTLEVIPFEKETDHKRFFSLKEIKSIHRLTEGQIIFSLKNHLKYLYSKIERFQKLDIEPNVTLNYTHSVDSVWGSLGNELHLINLREGTSQCFSIDQSSVVLSVTHDGLGCPWIVTGEKEVTLPNRFKNIRLDVFSNNTFKNVLSIPGPLGPYAVRPIYVDKSETMVVFREKDVFVFNNNLDTLFHQSSFLIDNTPLVNECFMPDQNGVIWYGYREGILLIDFRLSRFQQILKNHRGDNFPVRGIAEYEDILFVNSSKDGCYIQLKTGQVKSYTDGKVIFENNKCFPMMLTSDSELWTANDHLYQLDKRGNIIERIIIREGPSPRIWSFFLDSMDTWWLAMGRNFIYTLNRSQTEPPSLFNKYNSYVELMDTEKWHFLEDARGIWIAAHNGLYLLDRKKGIIAKYGMEEKGKHYLPANQFNYILRDSTGAFWLATGDAGLLRITIDSELNANVEDHLTRVDGLPSNDLYAIFKDDYNFLWISSADGLIRYDDSSRRFNVYLEEHGITDNEFNRLSYFKSPTGRMYFGGQNGVTSFNPNLFIHDEPYQIPLKWSGIQKFSGKKDSLLNITADVLNDKKLTFKPGDKYITFSLSLQDYYFSDKVRYSYIIEGLENEWTEIKTNTIQLSGLPYGHYTLRVKAKGVENHYSTSQLKVLLCVKRPFYLEAWFLFAGGFIIALSIWQFYHYRIKMLEKQKLLLENVVYDRTKKIIEDKQLIEKQAAQLRQVDELKTNFFTNISHELRTPLTLILSPLESVLKRNELAERDIKLLSLMYINGRELLRRVNELLDLASLDAGKLKLEKKVTLLLPFLKKLLSGFENAARLKKIDFKIDCNSDIIDPLKFDTDKVATVISNYLSNALHFVPYEGKVILKATMDGNQLTISVFDNGPGIHNDELQKIFERFYQSRFNSQSGGTGVGLAICSELAIHMKGRVWAESIFGEFSTFYLSIPVERSLDQHPQWNDKNKSEFEFAHIKTESNTQVGPTILVVEDNLFLVEFIKTILEKYNVITAHDGLEALKKLTSHSNISLVLSDIMMPVMDGFELLEKIKGNDNFRHIPVIMLTARQNAETKLKALRIGVDDYIVKPFQEVELLTRVERLLEYSYRRNSEKNEYQSHDTVGVIDRRISAADLNWLSKVEEIILENMGDSQFNITQLSGDLAMSTRRFQQKIKALTGHTPKIYQRQIQLEFARRLIENGSVNSVSEISYKVGFKDPHYFSTLFKDRFGKLPSEFF